MSKEFRIVVDGVEYHVEVEELSSGQQAAVKTAKSSPPAPVAAHNLAPVSTPTPAPQSVAEGREVVLAPLQGKIWDVPVKTDDRVKAGDTLVVIEAMKMENEIVAPHDAVVGDIFVNKGDAVKSGDMLVSLQ